MKTEYYTPEDVHKHPAYEFTNDVTAIADSFLKRYGLNHFSYAKLYDDTTRYSMGTHPQMSIDYYKYKLYELHSFEMEIRKRFTNPIL